MLDTRWARRDEACGRAGWSRRKGSRCWVEIAARALALQRAGLGGSTSRPRGQPGRQRDLARRWRGPGMAASPAGDRAQPCRSHGPWRAASCASTGAGLDDGTPDAIRAERARDRRVSGKLMSARLAHRGLGVEPRRVIALYGVALTVGAGEAVACGRQGAASTSLLQASWDDADRCRHESSLDGSRFAQLPTHRG